MPYKIGNTVVYGVHSVCKVADIVERDLGGKKAKYYVLSPLDDKNATTVMIPMDNEALVAKIRPILSAKEIYALIETMPEKDVAWIDDENERRNHYKAVLSKGDHQELIQTIKTLYNERKVRKANAKNLRASDDTFMKEAERMLYSEFAYVLKLKREQVIPFIAQQIELQKH